MIRLLHPVSGIERKKEREREGGGREEEEGKSLSKAS